MTIDLITATHETFEPFVKQTFEVDTEQGPLSLVLDNIKIFETSTIRDNHLEIDGVVHPPRKAFALTFEGPREPVLTSMTYRVTHHKIGTLELFLSGFRRDHNCMLYESTFN